MRAGEDAAIVLAHVQSERPTWAPALLAWELGNVFFGRNSERIGRSPSAREEAFKDTLLGISLAPSDDQHLSRTTTLARRHRLSFYDAAYLEVAITRQALLLTEDKALADAARAEGIVAYDIDGAARALAHGEI